MTKHDTIALLLATQDFNVTLDTSAVVRVADDSSINTVPDSLRGEVQLPPGVDLVFAKPGSEPEVGFNGPVAQDIIDSMLDAMPLEGKPWRFGAYQTGRVYVYSPKGSQILQANTVLFNDDGETVGLAVTATGMTIGEEAPTIAAASGAQA